MQTALAERIGEIPPDEFDLLDPGAGATASHTRVRQREQDGRWRVRYLRASRGGQLAAAVPAYACRSASWPDPAYDPATWGLPAQAAPDGGPGQYLFVGGYEDRRSGLHVAGGARAPGPLRQLLAQLAVLAAADGRGLAFPYLCLEAKQALSDAAGGLIAWVLQGGEAQLRNVSDPGWEGSLSKRVRYNLRHDRTLIAEAGLVSAVRGWDEVEDTACELIAKQNTGKGQPDHPEFVRLRMHQWASCAGVELVAFTAAAPGLCGVATGMVWKDEMDMREIGLSGVESPARRAAYFDIGFHQPIRFAQARGLRKIRLGMEMRQVKTGRGGVIEDLYGGVLSAADTRTLAEEAADHTKLEKTSQELKCQAATED
jgi:hypothetical protein